MLTTQFIDDTIRKDDEPILMKDRSEFHDQDNVALLLYWQDDT